MANTEILKTQGNRNGKSPEKDEWRTPEWLFKWAEEKVLTNGRKFELDAAATRENRLCERFNHCVDFEDPRYDNICAADWFVSPEGAVWFNPPFSKLNNFIDAAIQNSKYYEIVGLIKASTGIKYFHKAAKTAKTIWLINGRIKFLRPDGTPGPQPTIDMCLCHWTPEHFNGLDATILSIKRDDMKQEVGAL